MYYSLQCLYFNGKKKVDDFFARVFKENAGAAELIATLVIVGIVLALALIFRNQLTSMISGLWNTLVKNGDTTAKNSSDVVGEWGA